MKTLITFGLGVATGIAFIKLYHAYTDGMNKVKTTIGDESGNVNPVQPTASTTDKK